MRHDPKRERIAVLVPCLNEALTIGKVISDFQKVLPDASIYVIDNGSTDDTAAVASSHNAIVITERRRGKGYAVRTAFRQVDADFYVLVDGDDTYPAEVVSTLLAPVLAGEADMVVGSRMMKGANSDFRALNRLGNNLYPWLLRFLLGTRLTDILSGYRVMTKEFVKQIPIVAREFEIEAEMTIKAIERGYRLLEVPIRLRARPPGSFSKIRIFKDGYRILWTILLLFRDYRPMTFFGGLGLGLMGLALLPGAIVVYEFTATGQVPRLPSAILAVGLMLSGLLSIAIGLVLSAISRRFQELEYKLDMAMAASTSADPKIMSGHTQPRLVDGVAVATEQEEKPSERRG